MRIGGCRPAGAAAILPRQLTVRNPVVQVQPLRLLTEEAVRYFLTRAILPNP